MACGDVLSLEDLQTAKKHQIFEAEVITGKQGGVAGGGPIDYATNQVTGQVQKTMPAILRDLGFVSAAFDFTSGGTLTTSDRNTAVLWPVSGGGDGDWYVWGGALPKVVPAGSTPSSTGGVTLGAWSNVGSVILRQELAASGGAGLVGGVAKPVTWSGFAGGADPTGATPSDAAFSAAGAYEGDVRAEGSFTLTNPITRTKSVIEFAPGSTFTRRKIVGGNTALGSGIPTKTMFGRLVIRDTDEVVSTADAFTTFPDMGQGLWVDSKQVMGQAGVFISGDQREPIIGATAYVGLHSRHSQTTATPKVWGINPVVIKNVRKTDLPAGLNSETIGMEISIANHTDERGQPLGDGMLEGLFVSYVNTEHEGSAAIATGGISAGPTNGWRSGLWLDGISTAGTHIQLRDEVSANQGVRCGIDTTGVSNFTQGAMLLGRGHSIASVDTGSAIRTLLYIDSANEIVHGHTALPTRFQGSQFLFENTIRPAVDNVYDFGSSVTRGRTAYFGTGSINTSDERHKPIIERIPDSLLDAWGEVDWGNRFKFDDAIAEKGADGARWHFGLIAQWVRDVLAKHGIDGFSLGLLCYDEWEDQYKRVQTNEGATVKKTRTVEEKIGENAGELIDLEYDSPAPPEYADVLDIPAGNRYGIRYEEALSLEAAYQRRNYQRLLARVEALEVK